VSWLSRLLGGRDPEVPVSDIEASALSLAEAGFVDGYVAAGVHAVHASDVEKLRKVARRWSADVVRRLLWPVGRDRVAASAADGIVASCVERCFHDGFVAAYRASGDFGPDDSARAHARRLAATYAGAASRPG
jgi:hypothetical protein